MMPMLPAWPKPNYLPYLVPRTRNHKAKVDANEENIICHKEVCDTLAAAQIALQACLNTGGWWLDKRLMVLCEDYPGTCEPYTKNTSACPGNHSTKLLWAWQDRKGRRDHKPDKSKKCDRLRKHPKGGINFAFQILPRQIL